MNILFSTSFMSKKLALGAVEEIQQFNKDNFYSTSEYSIFEIVIKSNVKSLYALATKVGLAMHGDDIVIDYNEQSNVFRLSNKASVDVPIAFVKNRKMGAVIHVQANIKIASILKDNIKAV